MAKMPKKITKDVVHELFIRFENRSLICADIEVHSVDEVDVDSFCVGIDGQKSFINPMKARVGETAKDGYAGRIWGADFCVNRAVLPGYIRGLSPLTKQKDRVCMEFETGELSG